MGFFDLFKKKPHQEEIPNVNPFGECCNKLTEEGDLPFGWIYQNREFVEPAEKEFSHRLHRWIESKDLPPVERVEPLKAFIIYLESLEKQCRSKGECFEFWFYEIIASSDCIRERKEELQELTENLETLQAEYEEKKAKEEETAKLAAEMKDSIIDLLRNNEGILQTDIWKMFEDETEKAAASDIVYSLLKEGKIHREKSGRSFKLYYRG